MSKTYAQIAQEIASLQAEAGKLFAAEAKEAVQRVNALIEKYQLSAQDLRFAEAPSGVSAAVKKSSSTPSSSSSTALFSDGKGNDWGGRGPRPKWLRDAIDSGQDLESFKVRKMADLPDSQSAAAIPKSARKTTLPAKYRHPESGDVWSGRGSQPRWLKSAMKKRGARLEDFAVTSLPAPAAKGIAGADTARSARTQAAVVATKRSVSASKKSVPLRGKAKPPSKSKRPAVKEDAPVTSLAIPAKKRVAKLAKTMKSKATPASAKTSSRPATKTKTKTKTKVATGVAKKQTSRLAVAKPAGKKTANAGASVQKAATPNSPRAVRAAKKVRSEAAQDTSSASPVTPAPTTMEVAGTDAA